jgi:hypothetical protein
MKQMEKKDYFENLKNKTSDEFVFDYVLLINLFKDFKHYLF